MKPLYVRTKQSIALLLVTIMVLSTVAMAGGLVGSALASNHVETERPGQIDVASGETFQYTVELSSTEDDIFLFDEISLDDELTIVDAESDMGSADVDEEGAVVLYPFSVDSDSVTITVEVDENADPGSYTLEGTTVDGEANEYVETTTVSVGQDGPYEVENMEVHTEDIHEGDEVDVSADIVNTGDVAGDTSVTLEVDDTEVDTTTQSVDAGDEESVEFTFDAPEDADSYDVTISTPDDSETVAITVEEADDGPYVVEDVSLDEEVVEPDASVGLTATIANEGQHEGVAEITVTVDGTEAYTVEESIAGAHETVVTLSTIDAPTADGDYDVTVSTQTEGEEASATLTVDRVAAYMTDGEVETQDLLNAVNDWRNGVIQADFLIDVLNVWR